jgi:hypothetical protein
MSVHHRRSKAALHFPACGCSPAHYAYQTCKSSSVPHSFVIPPSVGHLPAGENQPPRDPATCPRRKPVAIWRHRDRVHRAVSLADRHACLQRIEHKPALRSTARHNGLSAPGVAFCVRLNASDVTARWPATPAAARAPALPGGSRQNNQHTDDRSGRRKCRTAAQRHCPRPFEAHDCQQDFEGPSWLVPLCGKLV